MNENNQDISFSNEQVHLENMPTIENITFEKFQENSLYVSLIVSGITTLVLLIIAAMIGYFSDFMRPYTLWLYLIIVLLMGLIIYTEIRGFKISGYALREHDILIKTGWFWQNVTVVPFNRIQHMEVSQGPIDRIFDLGSITLYTAGGSSVDVDGILPTQAESIKAYILNKNINQSKDHESGQDI